MQDIIQNLKSQHLVWQANLTKADPQQLRTSSGFSDARRRLSTSWRSGDGIYW